MSLKIFAKNTAVYSIGTIAVRISTFLLVPLYTHYLTVSEYGLLATLLLTTQILIMLIDFGMMPTLIRFADEFEKKNNTSFLLGTMVFVNLISGIIGLIFSVFVIRIILELVFNIESGFNYAILIAVSAIAQCFTLNLLTYFRSINKAAFFILNSILLTVLYLILTILFVTQLRWGIEGILLSQIVSYGSFLIFIIIKIVKDVGLKISWHSLTEMIRFGFPLMFMRGGDLVFDASILYMLGYFTSSTDVGIFSLATKLASILLVLLITPFQLSYEPYIYSQLDDKNLYERISKIFSYLLLIFVFSSLILQIALRGVILILAPAEYFSAYYLIFFILPIYAFRGINSISQTLIHIHKATNITGFTVSIFTLLYIGVGYLLLPNFGILAAILTTNLYWISTTTVLLLVGQKKQPVKFETKRIIILLSIYCVFSATVYFLIDFELIAFYLITLITLFVIFYFIIKSRFFNDKEKTILANFSLKILDWLKFRFV